MAQSKLNTACITGQVNIFSLIGLSFNAALFYMLFHRHGCSSLLASTMTFNFHHHYEITHAYTTIFLIYLQTCYTYLS